MCYHKISVPNPSRRWQAGVSKQFIDVPCGHCEQCIQSQQDDWFVRALFEYERCKKLGGYSLFALFTYDDEHLPYYTCPETGFMAPCFDSRHYKHFRDSLRTYLTRLGYDCSGQYALRFKFCPEYGGDYGRPHIHVFICVPNPKIPSELLIGHYNSQLKKSDGLLQKCWPYGFISWSKDHGAMIQGPNGVQYAMKYVAKESRWLSVYKIDEYEKWLDEQINSLSKYLSKEREIVDGLIVDEYYSGYDEVEKKWEYFKDLKRQFRRCMPRSLTSTYFGSNGIDYLFKDNEPDMDCLVNDYIDLSRLDSNITPKNSNYQYKIPRYYQRLLFKSKDGYGLDTLTPLGIKVLGLRYFLFKKRVVELYAHYFGSYNEFINHVGFASLGRVGISELKGDFVFLKNSLNNRTLNDLAMYSIVYRKVPLAFKGNLLVNFDLPFDPYDPENVGKNNVVDHLLDLPESQHIEFFRETELSFYISQHNLTIVPQPKKQAFKYCKSFYKKRPTYGSLPCFWSFDLMLEIIDKYEQYRNDAFEREKKIKKENSYQYSVITHKLLD